MAVRHAPARTLALACAAAACMAGRAQAQGVDPRGDWVTLATPHFRVHFHPGLEDQGRRAAADAERAWGLLSGELAAPRGPVDLVVADNADLSNGYATPLPSNRIVVYAQPPVDVASLRFYDDWLELVITHELTHVFHLDRSRGVWGALQHVFGRNPVLFPNAYAPSWLKEGLAVYFESRLTGAGRLVGTEHRLIARAAAVDGHVPRIDQLSLAGSVFPLGDRAYAYGSLLVDYVAHAGGPENVRRFVDRESGMLIPWRLDYAARRSFGLSFSEGWTRWRDSVVRTVAGVPAGGADAAWRELTREGWFVEAPRWLDARSLVVGVNDGRSAARAERVDVDGARRALGRRNSLSPNVALPGGGLLFAQIDYADPFTVRSDLYVQTDTAPVAQFGTASRGQRRLTFGARLSHPDVRRDGAIVAVQSGGGSTWLARVSADGRTVTPITAASADTQWTEPRWSPDGRRLTAVQLARGGRSAVVVLDTTGRVLFDVVRDRAVNATPSWSTDGRRVYWSSDRTGTPQLYVAPVGADARTGEPLRVSGVATGLTEPAPGGGLLAGLLYHADGYHVAVADTARLARARAGDDATSYEQSSRVAATAERAGGALAAYSPWRTLWPRYWTPVVGTSDGNSVTLGGATSGYDVLGRHSYSVQATWNVDNGDAEAFAAYRYSRYAQPFIDLSASQSWQYDTVPVRFSDGTTGGLPLDRRSRAAGLTLTLTRPRIRTGASFGIGAVYEQRAYDSPSANVSSFYADRLGTQFPGVFVSGSWVNTRRPVRSISPEDGVSLSGSMQQRWQNGTLGPQSRRAIGAARVYKSLDLPGFAHHVVALRVAGGVADAKTATELEAGGVSGSAAELIPGVVVGDPSRTFAVRGFGSGAQQGTRAAAASLEYRAPLVVPARGLGLLPVFADRLSVTAFADAASAWCPRSIDRTVQTMCFTSTVRSPVSPRWLASAGAEVGLDAALSYDAPYRFRLGVATPVAERELAPRAVSAYFTLGLSF
ncbi:MAG: PD40 domain-containing protein [Gemmatirosa sp.]|nr:PD40 domain-containing protein [Gemmatirosa sp.]